MKMFTLPVFFSTLILPFALGAAVANAEGDVSVTELRGPLHLLQGRGGNVVASVGEDGILLVDDDYAPMAPAYQQALDALSGSTGAPSYVLNTHWHGDHTGANAHWANAGAVIVGKTNTPEFAMAPVTENRIYGETRNPWDLSLTAGGSSGGAAASVAVGITPVAIGTDAGGSIRRPSSYTGIVGFRPSTGRVARVHGFPAIAEDFQAIGPMARCVADIILVMNCIAKPCTSDRLSMAHRPFNMLEKFEGNGADQKRLIRFVPSVLNGEIETCNTESVLVAVNPFEAMG